VINSSKSGHFATMGEVSARDFDLEVARDAGREAPPDPETLDRTRNRLEVDRRVAGLVHDHFDFIWRSLRRLGIPQQHTDDATQRVFWIAARKIVAVHVERERSFLFAIALRVAADERRRIRRLREVSTPTSFEELLDSAPPPDELLEQRRARTVLDEILEQMPIDQRAVFVLFELEDMTMSEVATVLELPNGTVASRLRRARATFEQQLVRLRARRTGRGRP
jgi:RNA polymerase sigma-70 factor, ECF subfamily